MMAAALLHDAFAIADMYFVGSLGPDAIAAVTLGGTVLGILFMFIIGITSACTALVAIACGAGSKSEADMAVGQSLSLAIIISIAAAIASFFSAEVLSLFGAEESVVELGVPYLRVSLLGAVGMTLSITFSSALRGAGDAMIPLYAIALGNIVNIILDPILIFGLYGFPEYGVVGSAYATIFSHSLAAIFLSYVFFAGHHEQFSLKLRDLLPRRSYIWRIFKIGIFGSVQMLIMNLSALFFVSIISTFGSIAIAAYGIGIRIRMVVVMPALGFGNAASALVGQNMGAGHENRAIKSGWMASGAYTVICLLITLAAWIWAEKIIMIFNRDPGTVETGADFLRWMSVSFVFIGVSVILGRALNGAGDTLRPMIMSGISLLVIGVPLSYILAKQWNDVSGVWAGIAISNILNGILMLVVYKFGNWKTTARRHAGAMRDARLVPSQE